MLTTDHPKFHASFILIVCEQECMSVLVCFQCMHCSGNAQILNTDPLPSENKGIDIQLGLFIIDRCVFHASFVLTVCACVTQVQCMCRGFYCVHYPVSSTRWGYIIEYQACDLNKVDLTSIFLVSCFS